MKLRLLDAALHRPPCLDIRTDSTNPLGGVWPAEERGTPAEIADIEKMVSGVRAGAACKAGGVSAAAQGAGRGGAALRVGAGRATGGGAQRSHAHGPRHDERRAHDGPVPDALHLRLPAPGRPP